MSHAANPAQTNFNHRPALSLGFPTWLPKCLLGVVAALVVMSVAGQFIKHVAGHPEVKGLVPMFYLDLEANVPAWYSAAALLLASLLLAANALASRAVADGRAGAWTALAAIFLFLSVDEISGFHELPIQPMRDAFNTSGVLYYGWILPGAAFVLAVGVCFARFLWNLPSRMRNRLILAGAVFVGGALGVEMISGWWADGHGEENLTYAIIITVEELCEMLGVVLFIAALIDHLRSRIKGIELRFV